MARFRLIANATAAVLCAIAASQAEPPKLRSGADVAELFEDDAEGLLRLLTNPTGDPGEGHAENKDVFSGRRSIKIIPMQRFRSDIPGWAYRIAERPARGEFRYLRYAWKSEGCTGIMVQLADDRGWTIRYTAGVDACNWGTKFVEPTPPAEWTVVTRDLFADFGPLTIRGIALTAFAGRAGYFDHIYLGRTVEDLDRIDATGAASAPRHSLSAADLERLWTDLGGASAPQAYAAVWRLVAIPDQSVPLVVKKLAATGNSGPSLETVRQWIGQLDADAFPVRETATRALAANLDNAAAELATAAHSSASPETRARANRLLELRKSRHTERERTERGVRVLEYIGSGDAIHALEVLAKSHQPATRELAQAALKRLAAPRP